MSSNLKQQLIEVCENYVESRINRALAGIKDLDEALKMESKSSAGDKYETGRAMINLEFDKLLLQLEQYKGLKKTLAFAVQNPNSGKIGLGSLVKTTAANYFLSIPAGEILVENEKFYAIGINSPIAQALLGKKEKENFSFNGNTNQILSLE
ncbi:MAG: transcription elongation factor [Flavobacteriaceae bacterium]|nr:transcription elongation factor [Flavobacteriaceae bacterium]